MKYPRWLPQPRHWVKSLELMLLSIPVGCFYYLVIITTAFQFKVGMFLLLIVPPIYFIYIHQILHDEPRQRFPWLPRLRCIANGIAYIVILVSAAILTAIIWLDTADASRYEMEKVAPWLTTTWVILAAYLFYLKDGIFWLVGEFLKLPGALFGAVLGRKRRKKKPKRDVEGS
jgi:hypothetical protein